MVFLKELIFNSFYFGSMCGLERSDLITVSTLCKSLVVLMNIMIFSFHFGIWCGSVQFLL